MTHKEAIKYTEILDKTKRKKKKLSSKEEFLNNFKSTLSFIMMSIDDIREDLDDLNKTLSTFIDNIDEYKETIEKEK